jgi:phospholipid/cholesterol/gamma-HCH transport system ATP-binding protein
VTEREDQYGEPTRAHDQPTRPQDPSAQPTPPSTERPTPPSGTPAPDQATRQSDVPPPPPGRGDQPTAPGREQPTVRQGQIHEGAPPPPPEQATQRSDVPPPPPPPSGDETYVEGEQPQAGGPTVMEGRHVEGEDEYQYHEDKPRGSGAEADAIEFIDVRKSFGRNTVLNGLNLGLPEGQISMILGPSGTGKSVCIKHMVGLLYPDEGDVLVHGDSVPNMPDDNLFEMRKKFGVLFQDGALFGSMSLYDNTAFPLRQHTDKGEDEIADIVNRRLKEVGLGGAGEKMPNELSGGMRKRAGFARALVLDPEIVLFDEPDSGLDPVRTALLCELIKEIHEENGGAYCVITHDIMSARRVAEYIAILWKGRIVESGPAEELFNSDNQFVRQFLSGEAQGPLGME